MNHQVAHGGHLTTEVPGEEETDYDNTTVRVTTILCDPYRPEANNSKLLELAAGAAFTRLQHQNPGALVAINIGLPQNPDQAL